MANCLFITNAMLQSAKKARVILENYADLFNSSDNYKSNEN